MKCHLWENGWDGGHHVKQDKQSLERQIQCLSPMRNLVFLKNDMNKKRGTYEGKTAGGGRGKRGGENVAEIRYMQVGKGHKETHVLKLQER
jgi:hypothetical protein